MKTHALWSSARQIIKFYLITALLSAPVFAENSSELADSNILFHWAEQQYPQYFSPAGATTQTISGYIARYYATTDTWLATQNGQVFVYGQPFNDFDPKGLTIKSIGATTLYMPFVRADSSLVINEIVAKAADNGNDWFEVYVTGTQPIALKEYSIVDDDVEHTAAALPDVTLTPGQSLVIYATDEAMTGYSVPFKLGAADSLSLFKNGQLINYLQWKEGDAPSGSSYGLLPDGLGTAKTLTPTPGTTNQGTTTGSTTPITDTTDEDADVFKPQEIREVYIQLADSDWQAILADPKAEAYKAATVTYNGVTLNNVGFRTKGNSSLNSVAQSKTSTRYSFKVDTNYYVDKQKLFGLKKLNFNNNFSDPSYMRESLSYDLMSYMGLPTPRWAYVKLYINGNLNGLYTMVEQVDDAFLEKYFTNSTGDLYKPGERSSNLSWVSNNFSDYKGMELKTNEDTSDHATFIKMVDVLNNGTDYASVLNVDEILRYFVVSTALTNLDSYQGPMLHNYYLYEENGVFSVIPWDFNMAFAGFNTGCTDAELLSFMIDEPTVSALNDRPLIAKLLANPDYLAKYHQYFEQLLSGPFSVAAMTQTIQERANLIREAVYADPTAFYTSAEFEAALLTGTQTTTTATASTPSVSTSSTTTSTTATTPQQPRGNGMTARFGLQSFVEQRVLSIRAQLDGTSPSKNDGSGSCAAGDTMNGGTPPNGGTTPPDGTRPTPPDGTTPPNGMTPPTGTTTTTTAL